MRRLGEGGMGEVLLAYDQRLDRHVAIKRLRGGRGSSSQRRERFRHEAKIAARLNHPTIVQIYDVVQDGDQDCIIMEYVEGENLRQRLQAGALSLSSALDIGHQIAFGMAEAHDHGVIHRDLKSENILITRAGQVKITDFGIAKLHDDPAGLAAGTSVLGTYRVMSPEQALGRPVDHRSDLFSFGVLLYEILTGTSPFQGKTPVQTVQSIVYGTPAPLSALVPNLPPALVALVERLLDKDPLLRPRDFHEVALALAELATDHYRGPCCRSTRPGDPRPRGSPPMVPDTETEDTGPAAVERLLPPAPRSLEAAHDGQRGPDAVAIAAATRVRPWRRLSAFAAAGAACAGLLYTFAPARAPTSTPGPASGLSSDNRTGSAQAAPMLYIAISPPRIESAAGRAQAELVAAAVRVEIAGGLFDFDGLAVVPLDDVDAVSDGLLSQHRRAPLQRELARAVGADEVVGSRLWCTAERCQVWLHRSDMDGHLRTAQLFQVAPDDLQGARQAIAVHLPKLYPGRHPRRAGPPPSRDDYDALVRMRRAYWSGDDGPSEQVLLAQLAAIRARSPSFVAVHRFEAELLRHRYRQRGQPADLVRALAVISSAEDQVPDAPELVASRFNIALDAGALEQARDALERLEAIDPGGDATAIVRGKWHAHHHRYAEALEVLTRAAAGGSWQVLYHLASVERTVGKLAPARVHLAQLLKRSPGNYAGLSLLANVELRAGEPACALTRYRALIARKPYYDECLNLGVAAMLLDRYDEAVAGFRCAAEIRADDALVSLNMAEALLLAGDRAQARRRFLDLVAHRPTTGHSSAGTARLIELTALAHLAQDDLALAAEARAGVDALLSSTPTPTPSGVLYTAAAVYALIGDSERAAAQVAGLLERGQAPAWFRFPWFDAVRRRPDLRAKLVQPPLSPRCLDPTAR
ncbi:protein kinase domain-containing protein [Haliangium sp.]|uniref:protein kinase domain-containing protein n=1 Tax=Haliangium sp. TaxID=2663208 RepID=UPI003D1515F2